MSQGEKTTMQCADLREDMLDVLYGEGEEGGRRRFETHQAACAECRRLRDALLRVDAGLSRHLRPPVLDPAFGARLRERLAHEPPRIWADWLPAAVHFGSCGVATAVCAVVYEGIRQALFHRRVDFDANGRLTSVD